MYPFTIAISHVPWLAKIMASPTVSSIIRKPKYDEHGQPKGISAVGVVSCQKLLVMHSLVC